MNDLEKRISAQALRDASRELRRDWERRLEGNYSPKGAATALQIAEWLSLKADRLDRECAG